MATAPNFGATVTGVRNLVLDTVADARRPGGTTTPRISDPTVNGWVEEGAGDVALALIGYEQLGGQWAAVIERRAKALAELYAAAFLVDTTHPERAPAGGRLGDVWWERYRTQRAQLKEEVGAALDQLKAQEDGTDTGGDSGGYQTHPIAEGRFRPRSGWTEVRF
jgi:hypothetical protein